MSGHEKTMLLDPFTRRNVGIDNELVPVMRALWAAGIETTGSCQGHPGYDRAVICFHEPRDPETRKERALFNKSIEAWTASRPDGARQVAVILIHTPWAHFTARWKWTFGDDPDNANPGSALLLPTADIPVLAQALTLPRRSRNACSPGCQHRSGSAVPWMAPMATVTAR